MDQIKKLIIRSNLLTASAILLLIFCGCENANEPIETNNLIIPEITNLTVSNNDISFEWYSYNTLKISYEIDRKIESEEYKPFARLDFTKYRIKDSTLAKGIIATYRIRAVYKNRTSEYAYSIPVVRYTTALIDSNFQNYYLYEAYRLNNGKFLLIGKKHYEPFMSLIFDPMTNQISSTVNLPINIEGYSNTLLDNGDVLLAGGVVDNQQLKKCFIYNTQSNSWSNAADLLYLQTRSSSIRMPDGKILITGGYSTNGVTGKCQLYDPSLNIWTDVAELNSVRAGHAINVLPDGKVLVTGGAPAQGYTSNTCEIYDPTLNSWTETSNLNEKRSDLISYLLPDNNVVVLNDHGSLGSIEIFNTTSNTWKYGEGRKRPIDVGASTQLSDGRILIVGKSGYYSDDSQVEFYYPDINKWVLSNTIPYTPYTWSVITSNDNKVYVFGGLDQSRVSMIVLN